MALIKTKPTSPGRRFVVKADRSHLHKGGPVASLTVHQNRTGARNNQGRITTRHKGGGHRHNYRVVDFVRSKDGVPGKVERLEYDPNRTAHLALVLYADGERRYILAAKGMAAALVACRLPAHVVAGASALLRSRERVHRLALVQVRAIRLHDEAPARRRRFGLDESHLAYAFRLTCRRVTSRRRRNRWSGPARASRRPSSSPSACPGGRRNASPCRRRSRPAPRQP